MRPIKFRGYDTQDGIREMVTFTLADLLAGPEDYELVDPDTVAQLVGYDSNGKEVYEGDTVIDEYVQGEKREAVAFLASVTRNPEGTDFFPFPAPFTTLKEDNQ